MTFNKIELGIGCGIQFMKGFYKIGFMVKKFHNHNQIAFQVQKVFVCKHSEILNIV